MHTRALVSALLLLCCCCCHRARWVTAQDFPGFDSGEKAEKNPDDGRVVGGYETEIEQHPYQVSLRYKGRHRCGGAIISEEWILTAAHCVKSVSAQSLSIKAGSSTLSGRGQVIRASRVITHEDYTRRESDYDIALIQLDSPLDYDSKIHPIDLAPFSDDYSEGSMASVTGWGVVESSGRGLSNRLRVVEVPLLTNDECAELYDGKRITERMICAGYVGEGGKDSCQGDSGGPLVQAGKLIGIVSWGFGCAQPNYPGVYTRVTALRSWISEKTGL